MDPVYIIINAFIHGFYSAGYKYLAMKLRSFISACQPLDLLYQFIRLLFGDKFRCLHRIYQ